MKLNTREEAIYLSEKTNKININKEGKLTLTRFDGTELNFNLLTMYSSMAENIFECS